MERDPLARVTIRAALVLGFGLVLGLWVFTGYAFTGHIAEMEVRTSVLTSRYIRAQDVLSGVRTQVNLSSILLRDALLASDAPARAQYRQRLDDSYQNIDAALDSYTAVVEHDSNDEQIGRLRAEIVDFQRVTFEVLAAAEAGGPTPVSDLLARHIAPRRLAAMAISDEIRGLNRDALVAHQVATADIHRASERQWWWRLGAALVGTVGIALLAILYAGRLEDRLRRERDKDTQHRRDLQRLSARLVSAQEEERRSISRELHDEVGQLLTAIKVELQLASIALQAHGEPATSLEDLQSLTDNALRTVRDLSQLLRPAMLDDLGLTAAIDWLLRGLARRHQVGGELVLDGMAQRMGRDTEVTVFRIVQEALTNIGRHAGAAHCTVRLTRRDQVLTVTVEDDGAGFDRDELMQRDAPHGLGLIGIRERVIERGGTVAVDSGPGRGTRIVVTLPVPPSTEPASAEPDESSELALPVPKVSHV